jgi:hypothetical protein
MNFRSLLNKNQINVIICLESPFSSIPSSVLLILPSRSSSSRMGSRAAYLIPMLRLNTVRLSLPSWLANYHRILSRTLCVCSISKPSLANQPSERGVRRPHIYPESCMDLCNLLIYKKTIDMVVINGRSKQAESILCL